MAWLPQTASPRPAAPASAAMTHDSVNNWRTIRRRPAPSACRSLDSRARGTVRGRASGWPGWRRRRAAGGPTAAVRIASGDENCRRRSFKPCAPGSSSKRLSGSRDRISPQLARGSSAAVPAVHREPSRPIQPKPAHVDEASRASARSTAWDSGTVMSTVLPASRREDSRRVTPTTVNVRLQFNRPPGDCLCPAPKYRCQNP